MKILLPLFLFTLCTAVLSQDLAAAAANETSSTTTEPASTPDQTSKSSQDTTTVAPTTTSNAPTFTTTISSSSEAPSTTKAPVTTTAIPASTTTKAPEPEKCSWNITQKDVTCIRADLKAEFTIHIEGKKHSIILGCNASSIQSDCSSNETQTLILFEANYYNLTMVFEKEANSVYVQNVSFSYVLPEGRGEVANNSGTMFKVKAGNSYLCKTEFQVYLENVTMEIFEIHIQAFEEKDNVNFGSVEECEADDKVSDIVPIAVGVALGALIIIVLIAYLVGRRRSRQKGYQSV